MAKTSSEYLDVRCRLECIPVSVIMLIIFDLADILL